MRFLLALAALLALSGNARAQTPYTITTPPPLSGFGTLSVVVTSINLSTVTVGPNSVAFPVSGLPGRFLEVRNSGASASILYVCPLGGTCSATVGIALAIGQDKTWFIPSTANGSLVSPTVISAGTATAIASW